MRIGTWNLAGRWNSRHRQLLEQASCDLWLLTEVPDLMELSGYDCSRTQMRMAPGRRWAAILSRDPMRPLDDPHPATAAAAIEQATVWCSVLPWRSCGSKPPWSGEGHAARTEHTVSHLQAHAPTGPLVWGGDWNHALTGPEYAGSLSGRRDIVRLCHELNLVAATGHLPHHVPGLLSIDHVAVPAHWQVDDQRRVVAEHQGARLSDHDAYSIDVTVRR